MDEDPAEALFQAIDDRNLVVHAHSESLAHEIHGRIPGHSRTLQAWFDALERASRGR